jgi:plasmid maintenance system antidote protein VapI
MKKQSYKPDIAIPPGETIAEHINYLVAQRLGMAVVDYEALLQGDYPIDERIAESLESYLGPPKAFWLNLEANYQQLLAEGKPKYNGAFPDEIVISSQLVARKVKRE